MLPTMRKPIVTVILFILPLVGCRTEELDVATAESRKAQLRNVESKTEHFRRRMEWASQKESEYRILVTEAEERLAEIRGRVLQLRQDNNRRAVEVAKLVNEGKALDADIAKRRQDITAKKAAVQKLIQEEKDLEKTSEEAQARLSQLKTSLLRVAKENGVALEKTKAFFRSMGWEIPPPPAASPEKTTPSKKPPQKTPAEKTTPAKSAPAKTTEPAKTKKK